MEKYKITCFIGDKKIEKEFIKIEEGQPGYKKIGSGYGQGVAHVAYIASRLEKDFLSRAIAYSLANIDRSPLDGKPGTEFTFYEEN